MAIDPEVIQPSSSAGFNATPFIPKWAVYFLLGFGVLVVVGILKFMLPLLLMCLMLGGIWRQAIK